jgi:hypothetical protein
MSTRRKRTHRLTENQLKGASAASADFTKNADATVPRKLKAIVLELVGVVW